MKLPNQVCTECHLFRATRYGSRRDPLCSRCYEITKADHDADVAEDFDLVALAKEIEQQETVAA